MSNTREVRYLATAAELRAEGKAPVLTGYASVFNDEIDIAGLFREVVRPGAFARSLREGADVPLLVNHDVSTVLARTVNGTVELREDQRGLHFRAELNNTTAAADALERVRRGDMSGMSFAFIARDAPPGRDKNGRLLRELKDVELIDISVVTHPAYQGTSVHARAENLARLFPRGASSALPNEVRSELMRLLGEQTKTARTRDAVSAQAEASAEMLQPWPNEPK